MIVQLPSQDNHYSAPILTGYTSLNNAQLQLRYYTFVKGGEVFENAKIQESQCWQMYFSRTIHCDVQCQEQAS